MDLLCQRLGIRLAGYQLGRAFDGFGEPAFGKSYRKRIIRQW